MTALIYLSMIYLILGLLIFVYLLIDEIELYPDGGMIGFNDPRPKIYYTNKIYLIIMILNCTCGVIKIIGGISSLVFRNTRLEIREMCKI